MASIIKSDNGVSSGITGIVQSADSSGQLVLQTTTSGGTATTAVTIDNTQKVTFANSIGFGSNAGITFNNSSATVNSTLNDYETGTWTPTDVSGASLTFTVTFARYTKIGNQVTVTCQVAYPSTASSASAKVGGLPFVNGTPNQPGSTLSSNSSAQKNIVYDSFIYLFSLNSTTASLNSALSSSTIYMSATYLI